MEMVELDEEMKRYLFACFLSRLGKKGRARYFAYMEATECGTKVIADDYVPESYRGFLDQGKLSGHFCCDDEMCVIPWKKKKR
jgi:hypothetical protein